MSSSKFLARLISLALSAAPFALGAGGAQSAVLTFSNRTNFEAAVLDLQTYDFNSDTVGQIDAHGATDKDFGPFTIGQSTSGATASVGDSGYTGYLGQGNFIQYFDASSNGVPLVVDFHSPVRAFGFDFNNVDTNDFDVQVSILGSDILVAPQNSSGFFGFISTDPSMTQSIFNFSDYPTAGGGYLGLDNFAWGTEVASAVPVPNAFWLMLGGLGLIGLVGWRRTARASLSA